MLTVQRTVEKTSARPAAGPLGDSAEVSGADLPDELTCFIGYLLRRVSAQFSAYPCAGEADLRESVVLDALTEGQWASQYDLGERLGVNRTLMVSVIDRLEEQGYAVRTRNPNNRRSYVVSLTAAGRAAAARRRRAAAERDLVLTTALTPAQRTRFGSLLSRLLSGGSEDLPDTADPQQPHVQSTEYLVTQAYYRLRKLGDDKLALVGSPLRLRHYGPLAVLDALSPCAQQQLAIHLAITEPAASALVEELVQAALVSRDRDRRDRRRYALSLTDAGREQLALLGATIRELRADVVALLPPGGEAELRLLLDQLLGSADQQP